MKQVRRIRIGNDITVRFAITRNGKEEDFEGKKLRIFLWCKIYKEEVTDFTIEGNVLSFVWYGTRQKQTGTYFLTLYENYGTESQNTVDSRAIVHLVSRSWNEDEEDMSENELDASADVNSPVILNDYNELANRPTLNGIIIEGNKTAKEYGISCGCAERIKKIEQFLGLDTDEEEDAYTVRLIGSFASGTPEEERYVWINGTKYTLDEEFDFKLNINESWTYGYSDERSTLTSAVDIGESSFGSGLKSIFHIEGFYPISLNSFFVNQSSLVDISGLSNVDTSSCEDLTSCFMGCSSLSDITPIKDWNVEKVLSIGSMFQDCASLVDITPIYNWNPISNGGFVNVFWRTPIQEANLANLHMPLLNRFTGVFRDCSSLVKVDFSNKVTKNTTKSTYFAGNATNLKELSFEGNDFDGFDNFSGAFTNATSLTTLIGPFYNWKFTNSDIHYCPLSVNSCVTLFNALKDNYKATITIKDSSYSQLSADQLAIATAKGWSVAKG